jgi:rod shape-determining protein MreD
VLPNVGKEGKDAADMKILFILPFIYIAGVLETTLGDALQVGHVGPDWMALLAVIWVLWVPGPSTLPVAGFAGLASDLFSPGRLGPAMAAYLVAGYVLGCLKSKPPRKGVFWQVPIVFASVTALASAIGLTHWLLGESSNSLATLLVRALGVGIYTAGLSVPVLMVLSWTWKPRPLVT